MKNTFLDRDKLVAEQIIREHVRKRIVENLREKTIVENKIRKAVRRLIEAETGTDEASSKTGINVLADLLEKIVPVLQDDYKMLTSSKEQRESFRNHIVHAIKNSLRPIEAATSAESLPENYQFRVDLQKIAEEIKIDLNPDGDTEEVSGEFIDIDKESSEGDDFVELEDQNETGRNFAATTFKKVEKQIVDAYDMLADEEDQNIFYDYLLTNILLYFDKFEDELSASLPNVTTPEYEKEKSEDEESEESDDLDDTLEDL
tara:strand:+ start:174 stop:953 length:780 start_codon:yes stop_codon:yes gene_type:complete